MAIDDLETTVNRELLAYACGRMIFCPDCKAGLDVETAVHIALTSGRANGITCGLCFDANFRAAVEADPAGFEIIDGREIS